jgi:RHS repeat-associated protein
VRGRRRRRRLWASVEFPHGEAQLLARLRQTTQGATVTHFLYDGDRLVAEYSGAGTLLRRYVHGAGVDEPLVWYEGAALNDTTRRWLIADHQGSIIADTNGAGAASRYLYGSYGEPGPEGWNGSRFRYTGQIILGDNSVRLYHYKARVYDPILGRFLQTDPMGYDAGDMNIYAYVGNDPLNNADPSGLTQLDCSALPDGCTPEQEQEIRDAEEEANGALAEREHELRRDMARSVYNHPSLRSGMGGSDYWTVSETLKNIDAAQARLADPNYTFKVVPQIYDDEGTARGPFHANFMELSQTKFFGIGQTIQAHVIVHELYHNFRAVGHWFYAPAGFGDETVRRVRTMAAQQQGSYWMAKNSTTAFACFVMWSFPDCRN